MAELTTEKRDRLRDSSFAYIDKDGERHLPINDESHVRNAISRFDQTDFEDTEAKHAAARKTDELGEAPRDRRRRVIGRREGRPKLTVDGRLGGQRQCHPPSRSTPPR